MVLRSFTDELNDWREINLSNCIGVDECLKACPVVPPSVTVGELNEATREGTKLSADILKFTRDCIQCGRCDTVCPTATGRSVLMISLKEKMVGENLTLPYHDKYFALKGHDKNSLKRSGFNFFVKSKWKTSEKGRLKSEKLASHIDKEKFNRSENLFYFGCYIFTHEMSAVKTVDIADRLNMDYEVLGGLKSCCGWPQLISGRVEEAESYHERLAQYVDRSSPKRVITGCAECYMSLRKIKEKYDMAFEPMTTPMWLNGYADKLNLKKSDEAVTFHDSCNVSRKTRNPEPARELLEKMNPIVEMERSGAVDTYCCGYWGIGSDGEKLKEMHKSRYDEARGVGVDKMVVECVTCLESFGKDSKEAGVEVIDIIDMVHERMNP